MGEIIELAELYKEIKDTFQEESEVIINRLDSLLEASEACNFKVGEYTNVPNNLGDIYGKFSDLVYKDLQSRGDIMINKAVVRAKLETFSKVLSYIERTLPKILNDNCSCKLEL